MVHTGAIAIRTEDFLPLKVTNLSLFREIPAG